MPPDFAIAYATPYMVDEGPGYANLGSKVFFVWGGKYLPNSVSIVANLLIQASVSSALSSSTSSSTRPKV